EESDWDSDADERGVAGAVPHVAAAAPHAAGRTAQVRVDPAARARGDFHAPQTPAVANAAVPEPVDEALMRSNAARAAWALGGMLLQFAAIVMFISLGVLTLPNDQFALLCAGGILTAAQALFALTRALGLRRRGLWRGVLRPAIFFSGAGVAGATGAVLGQHPGIDEVAQIVLIAVIVLSGVSALGVWFIPARPFDPTATRLDPMERDRRHSTVFFIAGGLLLSAAAVALPILDNTLDSTVPRVVMPAVAVPLMLGGIGCFIAGGVLRSRSKSRQPRPEKLKLPLQRSFNSPPRDDLDDVIQRHFLLMGFRLISKSRLLWSFERGAWASQFWSSSARDYKTTVNVAAYETPDGYRVTCYVDVQSGWNTLNQKQIREFAQELNDLEEMLAQDSAGGVRAERV
ncbi:MAG: hypothetical protein V3T70_05090, partial [Phycisphaerae bacterium]